MRGGGGGGGAESCCHIKLPSVLCASDVPNDFHLVIYLVTLKPQEMAFWAGRTHTYNIESTRAVATARISAQRRGEEDKNRNKHEDDVLLGT